MPESTDPTPTAQSHRPSDPVATGEGAAPRLLPYQQTMTLRLTIHLSHTYTVNYREWRHYLLRKLPIQISELLSDRQGLGRSHTSPVQWKTVVYELKGRRGAELRIQELESVVRFLNRVGLTVEHVDQGRGSYVMIPGTRTGLPVGQGRGSP